MNNIINKIKELKGIEYKSKEDLLTALEEQLQNIQLKDYSICYNFITLEISDNNKLNIIFDNSYKIIKLEITITKEIIF